MADIVIRDSDGWTGASQGHEPHRPSRLTESAVMSLLRPHSGSML